MGVAGRPAARGQAGCDGRGRRLVARRVDAAVAVKRVGPRSADEAIVAVAAVQLVGPVAAVEQVGALTAERGVGAAEASERVGAGPAVEGVRRADREPGGSTHLPALAIGDDVIERGRADEGLLDREAHAVVAGQRDEAAGRSVDGIQREVVAVGVGCAGQEGSFRDRQRAALREAERQACRGGSGVGAAQKDHAVLERRELDAAERVDAIQAGDGRDAARGRDRVVSP